MGPIEKIPVALVMDVRMPNRYRDKSGIHEQDHVRKLKLWGTSCNRDMMDDVAYKLGMDPVEFALKNMRRHRGEAVH